MCVRWCLNWGRVAASMHRIHSFYLKVIKAIYQNFLVMQMLHTITAIETTTAITRILRTIWQKPNMNNSPIQLRTAAGSGGVKDLICRSGSNRMDPVSTHTHTHTHTHTYTLHGLLPKFYWCCRQFRAWEDHPVAVEIECSVNQIAEQRRRQ